MARDPEKELLSYVVSEMNALFEGDFTENDMLSYARTLKSKMAENSKVMEQVANNSQEQAMMGGFKESMVSAIIDRMEIHQAQAEEVLSEEKIMNGLLKVIYAMLKMELSQQYAINNTYGTQMVAESNGGYGSS